MSDGATGFRGEFSAGGRDSATDKLTDWIRKGEPNPILREVIDEKAIQAKVDSAREVLDESPADVTARQAWVYYSALLRDFRYINRSRQWVKKLGLAGMFEESYGVSKIAVDSNQTE